MVTKPVLEPGQWCYYCDFEPQVNRDGIMENDEDAQHCPYSPDGEHHDPNAEPRLIPDPREVAIESAPPEQRATLREALFRE